MSNSEDSTDKDSYANGVGYPTPFDELAVRLCDSARRHICILSPRLDHRVFDQADLVYALSGLARRGPQSEIRILVANPEPIIQRGHRLLELARRLPSVLQLHKLAEHPSWRGETLVLRDNDGALVKPLETDQQAFYEPDSRARCSQYSELFNELWRRSSPDINFRSWPL